MMKILFATALAISALNSQEIRLNDDAGAGGSIPRWRGDGLLITFTDGLNDRVRVFDRTGRQHELDLRMPEIRKLRIRDVIRSGGQTILVGMAWNEQGAKAPGIFIFDEFGRLKVFRRTEPFLPILVTVAGDSQIWTFGLEMSDSLENAARDHSTVRVFDMSGQLKGEYGALSKIGIPRPLSSFQSSRTGEAALLSSSDRVGLFLPSRGLWIEFDLRGEVAGRWTMDNPIEGGRYMGIGFTRSGALHAFVHTMNLKAWGHFQLDRQASSWVRRSDFDEAKLGVVFGADGDSLVVGGTSVNGQRRFVWVDSNRR